MDIPGIVKVDAGDTERIDALTAMMAEAYAEEPYMKAFLEGIRAKDEQIADVSNAMMRSLIESGAPDGRVFCTEDGKACMIAYRNSEQAKPYMELVEGEIKAAQEAPTLGDKQAPLVFLQNVIMMPVADFEWYPDVVGENADYIHLAQAAVSKDAQKSGRFSELVKPLLEYARQNNLPVFAEAYSDDLADLYKQYGFEILETLDSPTTPLKERCMMFRP